MIPWSKRTPEIANLLNPSFCAILLYSATFEYQKKAKNNSMPFPLLYLVLPIILHKSTRNRVNSRTNMVVWLQRNPDVLVGFADRTKNLIGFTNEAIEFLLFQGLSNTPLMIKKFQNVFKKRKMLEDGFVICTP